jgi:hypothetical protein
MAAEVNVFIFCTAIKTRPFPLNRRAIIGMSTFELLLVAHEFVNNCALTGALICPQIQFHKNTFTELLNHRSRALLIFIVTNLVKS